MLTTASRYLTGGRELDAQTMNVTFSMEDQCSFYTPSQLGRRPRRTRIDNSDRPFDVVSVQEPGSSKTK